MARNKENIQKVAAVFRQVSDVVAPYVDAKKQLQALLPKGPVQIDRATQALIKKCKEQMDDFEKSDRIVGAMNVLDDLHEEQLIEDESLKPRDRIAHEVILHKAELLYEAGAVEGAEDVLSAEMDRVQIGTGGLAHPSVYLMLASILAQDKDSLGCAVKFLQDMKRYPELWCFEAPNKMSAAKMMRILTAPESGNNVVNQPS